jgi:hypothetical protein
MKIDRKYLPSVVACAVVVVAGLAAGAAPRSILALIVATVSAFILGRATISFARREGTLLDVAGRAIQGLAGGGIAYVMDQTTPSMGWFVLLVVAFTAGTHLAARAAAGRQKI